MSGTLGDLKAACQRELFNRGDLATQIAAAIQSACLYYGHKEFWFSEDAETAFTVNNQPSLALPTDLGWVEGITIVYSNYPVPMLRRDWLTMQQLYVDQTSLKGQPTDWAIFKNELWFWPTPNGAYLLTMWKNIQNAPPINDGDSNNWTIDAEELIRSRAVADIMCHVLKRDAALLELQQVAGEGFMSARERMAFKNLEEFTRMRLSSGRLKVSNF